jgi:uncharacterized protein
VEIVRRVMPLEHLPPSLDGKTLLHMSDIHVGRRVSSAYLIETFQEARDLAPDFVMVTGDFVTYRSVDPYRELARVLRHLPNGRLATAAALGNHDYGFRWRHLDFADQIARVAEDAGARVLRNDVQTFAGLQVAGLADVVSPSRACHPERQRGTFFECSCGRTGYDGITEGPSLRRCAPQGRL